MKSESQGAIGLYSLQGGYSDNITNAKKRSRAGNIHSEAITW